MPPKVNDKRKRSPSPVTLEREALEKERRRFLYPLEEIDRLEYEREDLEHELMITDTPSATYTEGHFETLRNLRSRITVVERQIRHWGDYYLHSCRPQP